MNGRCWVLAVLVMVFLTGGAVAAAARVDLAGAEAAGVVLP